MSYEHINTFQQKEKKKQKKKNDNIIIKLNLPLNLSYEWGSPHTLYLCKPRINRYRIRCIKS